MSSHRRVPAKASVSRRRRLRRTSRLRLVMTGAATLAVLGGGTAFACVGVGGGPAPVAAAPVGHPGRPTRAGPPRASAAVRDGGCTGLARPAVRRPVALRPARVAARVAGVGIAVRADRADRGPVPAGPSHPARRALVRPLRPGPRFVCARRAGRTR
ncbi:hypothetical protein [Kitasatospora mediocidica]|uniref:hypothetical protein n=1 Tax=Kitasatospora mediocidica TaxID=58352 RepID=UPI00068F1AF6|nr:hypothetical protein [Kitasatospora mediocidica]